MGKHNLMYFLLYILLYSVLYLYKPFVDQVLRWLRCIQKSAWQNIDMYMYHKIKIKICTSSHYHFDKVIIQKSALFN